MNIAYDPDKWEKTLKERCLDFIDAFLVFKGAVYEFEDTREITRKKE